MISIYYGNKEEIVRVADVISKEELWFRINTFLDYKGFPERRYMRCWDIDTSHGPVTHCDFGSWSRFIYYGDPEACLEYFKEYHYGNY